MMPGSELEKRMSLRITNYEKMRKLVPETVKNHNPAPSIWLDTGCGTGGVVRDNLSSFPNTEFVLADPSSENLETCKKLMQGNQKCLYVNRPTEKLNFGDESLDVITAIMCHHYYKDNGRNDATANCFRMLKKGGLYVTFEHVRYDNGQEEKDKEWRKSMISNGLPEEFADEMLSRRYHEFYPLTEEEFIEHLKNAGFSSVEVIWKTCSDIGLKAVK